jgi:hypothetical protein
MPNAQSGVRSIAGPYDDSHLATARAEETCCVNDLRSRIVSTCANTYLQAHSPVC